MKLKEKEDILEAYITHIKMSLNVIEVLSCSVNHDQTNELIKFLELHKKLYIEKEIRILEDL